MNRPDPIGDNDGPAPTTVMSSGVAQDLPLSSVALRNPRYQLCEEIERGGMGIVFLARDLQLFREVAVKVLRYDPASNPLAVQCYDNEARIMSYLSHPGIIPIYERGLCADGRPYHVMKLINGTTLLQMLRSGQYSTTHLLPIFADVCQTMAFAHSRGVLHLDLKPSNIMVGAFGEVHVMDWGLARFEDRPTEEPNQWSVIRSVRAPAMGISGTPDYMSPEQARGEHLDARSDVFGLGAILFELLIGRPPYNGSSVRQVYRRSLSSTVDSPLAALDQCDTDRAMVRLAKRCLSPRRRDRPRDAVEVATALAAYQESALQRAESDMNRFFELSLDLFCIADFEGYFRRINANFPRVLGYAEQDLLSRPFLDFVHPDDQRQTVQVMSVLDEGQPVVRFRNRYRAADGRYVTLEWTAKSIDSESLIFAVARDVTPRVFDPEA
ncbi:MAG: protein kinase [Planctomycetaceae bacterium]